MKKPLVGMRTFKTALSVWICLILFYLMNQRTPMIAAIAAVVVLKESPKTSLTSAKHRVMGNFLGALTALLLTILAETIHHELLIQLVGIPIGVIFLITISNVLNYKTGIVGGVAAFFVTYFSTPYNGPIVYAANRVIDTLIGALIAISVNYLVDKDRIIQLKRRLLG